jgi:hypothetical protein
LLTFGLKPFPFIKQNLILINLQALEEKINIQARYLQQGITFLFWAQSNFGVGVKRYKNKMGGPCSMNEGRGELHTGFWCGNLRERHHLEEPDIDGRIILRWTFRQWDGG